MGTQELASFYSGKGFTNYILKGTVVDCCVGDKDIDRPEV